ncbi:MAG TPA: PHB depolymerase family esterase [Mycobacteriales bacterium]|nr:PHB depolymerase family esterase [Mycobacteriales bacterium]
MASLLALSGCGGHAVASATPATTGCRSCPAGTSTVQLTVDGQRRVVVVHTPANPKTAPRPLVVDLHGSGSTAAGQEAFSGMDPVADRSGLVVAYPQGLIRSGTGFDWNIPGVPLFGGGSPPPGAASDLAFLTRLPAALQRSYCIDLHRVYATGMSGGGRMASQLGCDATGVYAAVAPVAGLRLPTPCPGHAEPVIAFHGTSDQIDPYAGNGQAYWTYSVPRAAQRWAAHDSCRGKSRAVAHSGYTVTGYEGCADHVAVELYAVSGEGHEWPGGPQLPPRLSGVLGPRSGAINADTTMWQFFTSYRSS